jgi:hypothetical protein
VESHGARNLQGQQVGPEPLAPIGQALMHVAALDQLNCPTHHYCSNHMNELPC